MKVRVGLLAAAIVAGAFGALPAKAAGGCVNVTGGGGSHCVGDTSGEFVVITIVPQDQVWVTASGIVNVCTTGVNGDGNGTTGTIDVAANCIPLATLGFGTGNPLYAELYVGTTRVGRIEVDQVIPGGVFVTVGPQTVAVTAGGAFVLAYTTGPATVGNTGVSGNATGVTVWANGGKAACVLVPPQAPFFC